MSVTDFLPLEYWLCAALIVPSIALAVRQRHLAWAAPFVAVLGTVGGWYMVEPLYFSDEFALFANTSIAAAFRCVFLFLVTLIISAPVVARWFEPKGKNPNADLVTVTPEQIVPTIIVVWIGLLLFGIWRMEGNVFA